MIRRLWKRIVAFLVAFGLVLALASCSGWSAPPAVSLAGSATNRIAPALVAIEEAQGNAAIAHGEDPARTVAPRWAAFWATWRVWVAAQRAWADAYEAGAPGLAQAEATAKAAACALPSALPPDVPVEVVAIDGVACALIPGVDAGRVGAL